MSRNPVSSRTSRIAASSGTLTLLDPTARKDPVARRARSGAVHQEDALLGIDHQDVRGYQFDDIHASASEHPRLDGNGATR